MGKHKKWTLEDKVKIVKEFKQGATVNYLNHNKKLRILVTSTVPIKTLKLKYSYLVST